MSEAVYLGYKIGKIFGSASSLMFESAEPARGRANFLCCHAAIDSCVTWPQRIVQVSRYLKIVSKVTRLLLIFIAVSGKLQIRLLGS